MKTATESSEASKRLKILLVFPPITTHATIVKMSCAPLGVAYLAAFVREKHDVKIIDAVAEGHSSHQLLGDRLVRYGLDFEEIADRIKDYNPDILGISCIFSNQWPAVAEIARRAKEWKSGLVIITGGTHPSFLAEECLKKAPHLDMVAIGEGENIMLNIADAVATGGDPRDVKGIAFPKAGNGSDDTVVFNEPGELVENLDDLPFPARDLLPMEKYFDINLPMALHSKRRRNTSIATSRGCVFNCTFCSSTRFWKTRQRMRSAGNVLDEIKVLKEDFGVEELKFEDDNLTYDQSRAREIFQGMIDRGLSMPWNTPNGVAVWTLDDDMFKLMKQSGCYEVTLAIESGDQYVLDNIIKKPLKLESVRLAAKKARKAGLFTVGYIIIGFPGETKEQINNTLNFTNDLKLDKVYPFIFNPLPGTPLYELCVEKGYISSDYAFEQENYFRASFSTPEWGPEDLDRLQKRMFWKTNIILLFRNPLRFFKRYDYLLKRPSLILPNIKYVLLDLFGYQPRKPAPPSHHS